MTDKRCMDVWREQNAHKFEWKKKKCPLTEENCSKENCGWFNVENDRCGLSGDSVE